MSLFDSASLVVTPNGTKASKLYSIIPTDGSGDLTVTRATTATRVNSSGLVATVSNNVPRLDYTGSTCPSILVEPQRTNLLTYSEGNLSTYDISANCTNASPSISGFSNSIQVPSTGLTYFYKTATTTLSQVYTLSCFIKMDDNSVPVLGVNSSLGNVSLVAKGAIATDNLKVTLIGNNIYRISATTVGNGIPGYFGIVRYSSQTLKSFKISGIQLELGSYETSYIPTTTAAVTRNADVISKTGISSLIGQTEGTILFDGVVNNIQNVQTNILNTNKAVTTISSIALQKIKANNKFRFDLFFGAGGFESIILNSTNAFSNGIRTKVAIRYKSGSFAMYVNGNLEATSSATFTNNGSKTELFLNDATTYFGYQESVSFNSVVLFTSGLTNAELEQLTTI